MLTFQKIVYPSGKLGEDSCIPDFSYTDSIPFYLHDETIANNELQYFGKGTVASVLPHKMQKSYSREIIDVEYNCAVLENEYLKAVFIPELGGRLYSLFDKKAKKDILYENKAIRFANLALCNAWFAGGTEWNIGVRGHSHFTCRPIFACKVIDKKDRELLKMYEYEPIRGLVFAMYFHLEDNKLVVNTQVENTLDKPTYMYWWSNTALSQTENLKVVVPTNKTFVTTYKDGGYNVSQKSIPIIDGVDISDPMTSKKAIDYFFNIDDNTKKWQAVVDTTSGYGYLQTSSLELKGRKLFLWGNKKGGRHWNAWLTDDDGKADYLEVQAGYAKTQFEHIPLNPHEKLKWAEIYTSINIENCPTEFFGIQNAIEKKLTEESFPKSEWIEEKSCSKPFVYGSGRARLVEKATGKKLCDFTDFTDDSLTEKEQYYLDLLSGKNAVANEKTDFENYCEFLPLILNKGSIDERDYFLASIIEYSNNNIENAGILLEKSVKTSEKAYNLCAYASYITNVKKDYEKALSLVKKASCLEGFNREMACLLAEICIKGKKFNEFIERYFELDKAIQNDGRIKMYLSQCYVGVGKWQEAEKYLNEKLVVPDMREGEFAISKIWIDMYRLKYEEKLSKSLSDEEVLKLQPIPSSIDFRMH